MIMYDVLMIFLFDEFENLNGTGYTIFCDEFSVLFLPELQPRPRWRLRQVITMTFSYSWKRQHSKKDHVKYKDSETEPKKSMNLH